MRTRKRRLKSSRRVLWFFEWRFIEPAKGFKFLVAAFSFIASSVNGVISIVASQSPSTATKVMWVVSLLVILFDAWKMHRDLYEDPPWDLATDLDKLAILRSLSTVSGDTAGYQVTNGAKMICRSERVDAYLCAKPTICYHVGSERLRRIVARVREKTSRSLAQDGIRVVFAQALRDGKMLSNDRKVCLVTELNEATSQVELFRGNYFLSILTNELPMCKLVAKGGSEYTERNASPFRVPVKFVDVSGATRAELSSLADSGLSNNIGVSTIAVTSDHHLCLWVQNYRAMQSEHSLAPSGSGSSDWKDFRGSTDFLRGVVAGMEREFAEESTRRGASMDSVEASLRTKIVGYFRNVSRCGKPEFLGVTYVNLRYSDLTPNTEEVTGLGEFGRGVYVLDSCFADFAGLKQILERTRSLPAEMVSIPLLANVDAFIAALNRTPGEWQEFLRIAK